VSPGNLPEGEAARLLGQGNANRTKEGVLWFLLAKCHCRNGCSRRLCVDAGLVASCVVEPAARC
jgi:hypothetical protein